MVEKPCWLFKSRCKKAEIRSFLYPRSCGYRLFHVNNPAWNVNMKQDYWI